MNIKTGARQLARLKVGLMPGTEENGGQFRKGNDPRRHRFTREECSRGGQIGFWAMIDSIVERYPKAIMADGRHMVVNALR